MKTLPNIAIAVLAAGKASRMGTAKQLLHWGEITLIEHSIKTALNTNKDVFVVLGSNAKKIETQIKSLPITILENKSWQKGIGSSITCAINYILKSNSKVDGILLTLADQPFIDTTHLNKMISSFHPNNGNIIATKYPNNKKGVPTLFDKFFFNELATLKDDIGAKYLIEKFSQNIILVDCGNKYIDIDTPEDYEKWHVITFGNSLNKN